MQLLHLVHFLNACAYFQVHLGLMTRAILTSPKFSINSSYLHDIGAWASSSWPWICVADPSHVRYVPSHPLAGESCAHKADMFGHYFSEDMKFCSQLCCTGVTLHMLLVNSFTCTLPYSFWIHWPLSATVDKMEEISKIRSSQKAVKTRAWIDEGDPSEHSGWGKDFKVREVITYPVWLPAGKEQIYLRAASTTGLKTGSGTCCFWFAWSQRVTAEEMRVCDVFQVGHGRGRSWEMLALVVIMLMTSRNPTENQAASICMIRK